MVSLKRKVWNGKTALEFVLIIKIFFSIQKFIAYTTVKFSRGYMNSERKLSCFVTDKKSDLSHCFQDKKWVAMLVYLSDIFSYINKLNLKLQGPDTTIFNAWNKTESFKNKLKLWLNMIAGGNNEMFQSYSDYIMEADDFYSQISFSDIIAAHLKMLLLLFEKYYPKHEDLWRQNMWILNTFLNTKRHPFP